MTSMEPLPAATPPAAPMPVRARTAAFIVAGLGILQAILGATVLGKALDADAHGMVGFFTLGASIVAAIIIATALRGAADRSALWLAIGVAVLAVIQVGLGEAHLEHAHIGGGVLFLVASVWLASVAARGR